METSAALSVNVTTAIMASGPTPDRIHYRFSLTCILLCVVVSPNSGELPIVPQVVVIRLFMNVVVGGIYWFVCFAISPREQGNSPSTEATFSVLNGEYAKDPSRHYTTLCRRVSGLVHCRRQGQGPNLISEI
jgi:hypothetical protein